MYNKESRPHRWFACFTRTQSQRTYVEGEILTIPPTQLVHAVVSCLQPLPTGEVCDRLATLSPGRKQLEMSSNGSEIETKKLLVPAYLSLSGAQYRNHNHFPQPPPNGQKQEEAETISDHSMHLAC